MSTNIAHKTLYANEPIESNRIVSIHVSHFFLFFILLFDKAGFLFSSPLARYAIMLWLRSSGCKNMCISANRQQILFCDSVLTVTKHLILTFARARYVIGQIVFFVSTQNKQNPKFSWWCSRNLKHQRQTNAKWMEWISFRNRNRNANAREKCSPNSRGYDYAISSNAPVFSRPLFFEI